METSFHVPAGEIDGRRSKIQKRLQARGIDGLLVIQRVDLFYFSGTAQNGVLYIPAEGAPLLMVKKYLPRAQMESSLEQIVGIRSMKEIPALLTAVYGKSPGILGLEFDVLPVDLYFKLRELFRGVEFVDGAPLILKTRMRKSTWEIEQMDQTAELSRKTFEYMQAAIRPGFSEMEFTGMFETFSRRHGHGGMLRVRNFLTEGYPWHLLSGRSGGRVGLLDSPASGDGTSAAFPCGAGHKRLEADEPIMIDFSSVMNGYHLDETRMFAIGGMPARAMKACQAAMDIHDTVLQHVRPGVAVGELFDISVARARALGFDGQYLGPAGNKVAFIGHGVGLELVEPPFIARGRQDRLMPGMTMALEPKLVFENEFCAGIEDVFLVTETGCRMISTIPGTVFLCGHP